MYSLYLCGQSHWRFGQLFVELIDEVHLPIQALDLPCSEAEGEDGLFPTRPQATSVGETHAETGTRGAEDTTRARQLVHPAETPSRAPGVVRLAMSARTRVVGVTSYLCAAEVDVDGALLLDEA